MRAEKHAGISPDTFAAFVGELQKLAYDAPQHTLLAQQTFQRVPASPYAQQAVVHGALEADKGMRHPWLPHNDPIHSFAGSQTLRDVGQNVVQKQNVAAADIAKSIAQPGLLSGARAHRGLKNLGEANHQLSDIAAHYEKPVVEGSGSSAFRGRVAAQAKPGHAYGGMVVGAREHVRVDPSGLKLHMSETDQLSPATSAVDRAAVSRAEGFGVAAQNKVRDALVREHGMHPEEAARRAGQFFSTVKKPSLASRVLGEASRDSRYLRGELARALSFIRA